MIVIFFYYYYYIIAGIGKKRGVAMTLHVMGAHYAKSGFVFVLTDEGDGNCEHRGRETFFSN